MVINSSSVIYATQRDVQGKKLLLLLLLLFTQSVQF